VWSLRSDERITVMYVSTELRIGLDKLSNLALCRDCPELEPDKRCDFCRVIIEWKTMNKKGDQSPVQKD